VISSKLDTANEDRKLETEVFLSLEIARKETAEINRSYRMTQEDWNAEKEILLSKLAKLQSVASEKGSLSDTNRDLKTEAEPWKAQLVSEVESARKMTEEWKEAEKKLRKELEKKDEEYRGAISRALKHLQEAKKRLHTETSMKEEECRTLHLDKKNLEATVLKLKKQIQVISSELETTNEDRKLEKEVLFSLEVARKETAEISRSYRMAEENWNAEKEILLSRLAELQTKLQLVASEKGSLSETNRELKTEAESLKVQWDDYNDKLVGMQDERQDLKAASVSIAERLEALQVDENVKQNSDVIQDYNVGELSKRIVELQETHVKVLQEFETFHAEAIRKCEEMTEKHSELFSEKEEQEKTINSLRGQINSLMNEKSLLSRNIKEATKKFEDFAERCLQIEHSTIAEEERSALVDIANRIDVHEKPKQSNLKGNQNPSDVNGKPNPSDVIETQSMQENIKPSGGYQTKTPKKSHRKRR